MPDLVVAGAGMAGLIAAVQARQHGAAVDLREKLDRPGGSMRLSSGVIWRHREFERFRDDCPAGDPLLQRCIFDRLDRDIQWLRALGAPVLSEETANPLTVGCRFEPEGLTKALVDRCSSVKLGQPLQTLPEAMPVVLATGGFPASRDLLRRHVTPQADELLLRTAPGGTGDGLRLGELAGAQLSAGFDEAYGRNMPAPPARVPPGGFIQLAQLQGHVAEISNSGGEAYEARTWSQIDVFQWTARQPRARAWFRVGDSDLDEEVGGRSVKAMVDGAAKAGAPVRREAGATVVETVAGVTSTLGGLAVDERANAAPGIFAAGGDVGGIATGGYSSGLAAALVLGRIAADSALGVG